ncbi:MAG TPA: DEAD/DEAH box helicase, partial [Thermoanaerobaculia bacterium]
QVKLSDLCRHIAMLLATSADDEGLLISERFEASVWKAVGWAAFSEAREAASHDAADPREQLLRKYVLTAQEEELIRRGSGSARLQWESSPWYRWSRALFLAAGDGTQAALVRRGDVWRLAYDSHELDVPASAIESIVNAAGGAIAMRGGFHVERESLVPSLRLSITPEHDLLFTPLLVTRDGAVHDRAKLPHFGRYFLVGRTFATPAAAAPMFAEESEVRQAMLFESRRASGIPFDRETKIAEADVLQFLEKHRAELARMPADLAPECIRDARPMRLDDEVLFDFSGAPDASAAESRRSTELHELALTFKVGRDTVSIADIAAARKAGRKALNRGNIWIDVADAQFAWADAIDVKPDGRILATKLEYLRIRGSLRGKAVFRGDAGSEQLFRMFDQVETSAEAPSPADLGIALYDYQQTGYRWLWLLQQNGFGGLLCDDMGLGKTHQAMALITALARTTKELSVLVVCPTSLVEHWREKLDRYVPELRFDCYYPRPEARAALTSYGILRNNLEQFRARKWDLLVLDEAQTIKNAHTATHQALRAIDTRIAIGLTGTPVENHEGELRTLLDFVVPGYLPKTDDRAMLQRLVRPFVLRRTKAQVLTELPPKIVDKRYCELTPEQALLYRKVLVGRAHPLRAQLRSGARIPYIHVFAALNYLKQICNHPASVSGEFASDAPSAKWELFTDLLAECMSSGLKVVVFSQYLPMLRIIEKHLTKLGHGYASIKGSTQNRGDEIRRFQNDPDCRVFTASLRAGGLGIDLTAGSVVIHYDRWWNQAREDQATDRVHRLGQNKGVQVIKLITRNTVEEKIDELIERKAALASDIIRPDDPSLVKQFSADELDALLS